VSPGFSPRIQDALRHGDNRRRYRTALSSSSWTSAGSYRLGSDTSSAWAVAPSDTIPQARARPRVARSFWLGILQAQALAPQVLNWLVIDGWPADRRSDSCTAAQHPYA
jgi:hypothetical protein